MTVINLMRDLFGRVGSVMTQIYDGMSLLPFGASTSLGDSAVRTWKRMHLESKKPASPGTARPTVVRVAA